MMYPTKNTDDYLAEVNRLFSKNTELDVPDMSFYINQQSLFNSPMMRTCTPTANQSSSSADSISPESFPDINRQMDIPFTRKQRPIVGRKMFGSTDPVTKPITHEDLDFNLSPVWQPDTRSQAPKPTFNERYSQNAFYELFPENKEAIGKYMKPNVTPVVTNISPSSSSYSPTYFTSSPVPVRLNRPIVSPNFMRTSPNASNMGDSPPNNMCTFCRKNGETPVVYMTHTVRARVGNKIVVTCPILRSHICSTCGASGDNAHTITYCPVLRSSNNGHPLQSTTITLKNTRVKSNGRRRY